MTGMAVWPGRFRAHVSACRSERGRHLTLTGQVGPFTPRTVVRGCDIEPFVNMLRDCLLDALTETTDPCSHRTSGTMPGLPAIKWRPSWSVAQNDELRFFIYRRNAVCPRCWDMYFDMDEDTMRELCAFLGGVLGRCGTDSGEWTEYSEGLFR